MEITEIIDFYKNSKIRLNKGIEYSEINELEKYLEFKFPEIFKQFYNKINGFKNSDWNENSFSIFPIERIKTEYDSLKNRDFIPFCDYLINSHQIGFYRKTKEVFINYENILVDYNDKVADNFELSMIEIINNTDKIY